MKNDRIDPSQSSTNKPPTSNDKDTANKAIKDNKIPSSLGRIGELQPPPPDSDKKRTKKQHCYTRDPGLFWVGIATLIAVIFYACYARQQAVQMKVATEAAQKSADAAVSAAKTAEQTLVANIRPWIAMNITIGGNINFNESGGNVPIIFVPKNVGNSPAMDVRLDAEVVLFVLPDQKEIAQIQDKFLDRIKARSKSSRPAIYIPGFEFTLFPGSDFPRKINFSLVEIILIKGFNRQLLPLNFPLGPLPI